MPVIQQQVFVDLVDGEPVERRVSTVAGLPGRWGRVAYARLTAGLKEIEAAGAVLEKAQSRPGRVGPGREEDRHGRAAERYKNLGDMIDRITAAPIPVDATDAHLCVLAERYADECATLPVVEMNMHFAPMPVDPLAPGDGVGPRQYGRTGQAKPARDRLAQVCILRGIEPPTCDDDGEAVKRMVDPAWWRLGLRRAHGRAFEHAAMLLGFVSVKTGSYCSDETVARRRQQNERNAAALKGAMLKNEAGQEFSLYDLAQKGMANKSNRKGELMLRMAGCEDVAREYGHVGLFVTGTCPSKFHAVLHGTGEFNPKYADAGSPTPRQAQKWLNTAWVRTRAQNDRDGLAPYGFRIAEPHHDGTPHWHMLLFMPRDQVETFKRNMSIHWLAEDGNEPGAVSNRVKFVEIDPAKGTAAGYIAKYVGKNIDDSQGGAFDEEGQAMVDGVTPACERVDAWASVWGIRQFQGLGMPPVTVWRELRRVKDDHDAAPDYVQRALMASRRIEGAGPTLDGKPLILQGADFAEYIRAQGGIHMGRDYLVRIATVDGLVKPGRYGVIVASEPYGVYGVTAPKVVCESMRFTWTRVGRKAPRSPLNNCTRKRPEPGHDPAWWEGIEEPIADFDPSESYAEVEAAGLWFTEDEIFWGLATAGAEAWAGKAEFLEGRGEDASAAWARCAEYLEVMANAN